jgi:hypothetical protein
MPARRSPLAIVTDAAPLDGVGAPALAQEHNPNLLAPIPKVPIGSAANAPPLSAVRSSSAGSSKPDFIRGFGLDIPEESEEEGLEPDSPNDQYKSRLVHHGTDSEFEEESGDMDEIELNSAASDKENENEEADESGLLTARHSRHVSKLSAALSMRSFSGLVADGLKEVEEKKDDERDGEMSVFGHKMPKPLSVETGNLPHRADTAEEWSASVSEGDADEEAETEVRCLLSPLCFVLFHRLLTSLICFFFPVSAEHWLFLQPFGRRTCSER